ncbi:MAG: OmpA domain protein, partial [uncultured Sulfurovum sp.]
ELEVENNKIAQLLIVAKENNAKSKNEIEVQTKELAVLMSEKEELVSEKAELQGKIDKLLDIAEKGTQRAELEFNSLISKEKVLETENVTLKATIEEIKELNKANVEIEKLKKEKRILEANMKKAAAEAKAKEEAEKAAAEAKAKEEAEKAAAEAKAKEEAEKAAAEAKAKEEAEKAAAEAKAKEEAEKAAAQAKAKEEAEKVAQMKAKEEVEKKIMNAFSLTKVAFQTGSMLLTTASKERLDVAIEMMKQYEGYTYKIQGHTDSRGREAFNLSLSTKRAEAVKAYLVSKGIDENILSAEGFGSAQPIASNDTKDGREENRRVVFEIVQ